MLMKDILASQFYLARLFLLLALALKLHARRFSMRFHINPAASGRMRDNHLTVCVTGSQSTVLRPSLTDYIEPQSMSQICPA